MEIERLKHSCVAGRSERFYSAFTLVPDLLAMSYAQISLGKHSHTKKDLTPIISTKILIFLHQNFLFHMVFTL